MAEYIDKEKLLDRFDELCDIICPYSKKQRAFMCSACSLGSAFDAVDEFPTEDVQPVKHGYWKHENNYCLVCSECGNPAEINGISGEFMESPYCNECGARMDGET